MTRKAPIIQAQAMTSRRARSRSGNCASSSWALFLSVSGALGVTRHRCLGHMSCRFIFGGILRLSVPLGGAVPHFDLNRRGRVDAREAGGAEISSSIFHRRAKIGERQIAQRIGVQEASNLFNGLR